MPRSGDLPTTGNPNSSREKRDKKGRIIQRRYYGGDGKAIRLAAEPTHVPIYIASLGPANLELTALFDQTRQPIVLENGEFARHRAALERTAPAIFTAVAELYARLAEAESAMERRGPANSLKDEDRAIVERWEGDARAAQRALREALGLKPVAGPRAAIARLRGSRLPG